MTTDRRDLVDAEEAGWVELMDLVSSVAHEQLDEPGYTEDGWSVKDLIAHIGAWHAEAANVLEQMRHGTYERKRWDVDALNRQFHQANKNLTASAVMAECAASRYRMLVEWNALSEITPEAEEWFRESGPGHYAEHVPRLREWVRSVGSR